MRLRDLERLSDLLGDATGLLQDRLDGSDLAKLSDARTVIERVIEEDEATS